MSLNILADVAIGFLIENIIGQLQGGDIVSEEQEQDAIRQKKWGDDPNPINDANKPTVSNENINDKGKNNFVYKPNQTIYNVENNFVFVENSNSKKTPDKPSSRLPIKDAVENTGQTATQIAIGAPITLQQSIQSQTFGSLLFNPVENKQVKIRQVSDPEVENTIEELETLGLERYDKWLSNYPEQNDLPSIYDPMVLIVSESLRGLSGKQGLVFGSKILRFLCSYNTMRSLNVFIGVSDTIPKGYEIVDIPATYNLENEAIDNLEINRDSSTNSLYDEFFPATLDNWEGWLKTGVSKTYNPSTNDPKTATANNLIDLLQLSLAQIYNRLGLADFPYTVPENLNLDIESDQAENTVTLQNFVDLTEWIIQAFDGVLGEFPINMEIQDNDLIQTGDQPLKFSLPNIAETLAELTGKQLLQEAELKALTTIALSSLAETGTIKQQVIQNYYLSAANQEYLGYQTSKEIKEIELLFDPSFIQEESNNQTLDRIMRPSIMKVPIESNIDDDTLEAQLAIIVEACRIMKAQNWRSFNNRENIASDFISLVKNASNLAQTLGVNTDKNLDEFFTDVEKGFSDKIGGNAANKPYGREYDRRPKIKKLDTNE